MRADRLLVHLGLADSRSAAQRLIAAGCVRYERVEGGQRVWRRLTKPSLDLPLDAALALDTTEHERYVSRAGLKLAGALAHTGLDVVGWVCLDVGQSTGGFTDCLLQAGAARVVGVDVGHGQLHPRLRADARVVCLEGVNARHLSAAHLGVHLPVQGFDLIVVDAAFISLTLLLPPLATLLAAAGQVLALAKPQFEVGPRAVGKGGIVREASLYAEVEHSLRAAAHAAGLRVKDWFDSPITGADGNREFFLWAELSTRPGG
ncbi:MAG: TlyA family RNA methyltransferase [Thiobacillaceae bacterium]|nr:TlyA family RNA methyltransferase [Thiobacillaceae bacterium]MCX7672591.1 TlyA family RNA methyltransferase [Thiobacillaceae bacterium]MDW8322531.1 TlyA family RNA methyltransferase [Burkholderiales bacterium]